MNRKTALLVAVPTLFGLSCCCAAFALPFGAAGLIGWADEGTNVETPPGTAAASVRVGEWYLGPGLPTYEGLLRRSYGDLVEYRRFSAVDVHDRLGIPGLSAEGTYAFTVRTPDGRGGHYDPGPLEFLMLRADATTDVIVVVHGGVDLHAIVVAANDEAPLVDVDVAPEALSYGRDGLPAPAVFGRTDATGTVDLAGLCGAAPGADSVERAIVFRREGFRERREPLSFPALCGAVTHVSWRVPLEPLAATTLAIAPDLTVTRVDAGSPAQRAGLAVGDRVTAVAGVSTSAATPRPSELVERFDRRGEELWLTVLGADGATRELRTVLAEPRIMEASEPAL